MDLLDSILKLQEKYDDDTPAMARGGRIGFSTAGVVKNLLKKIPKYEEIPIKDRTAEKKFMKEFLEYADKKFSGNFSKAAESIGENRNKIKSIFDRVRLSETGTRKGADVGKGSIMKTTIPTPENVIPYKEATTLVKKDKNYLKNKIKNFDKNKFYSAKDIGNILGIDVSNKKLVDRITGDLKRFKVDSKLITGNQKEYKLGDVVNKITKGYEKKLVKGQKSALSTRLENELKLDPELKKFIANFNTKVRNISKGEDIFLKNAVEDVGHPLSIKITGKYPKLTKNSNINKLNTLTFQDPVVNQKILEATGYEAKHDVLLKKLNNLVNKKIGPKELKELQEIKSEMNALHSKVITDVSNLSKEGTTLYNPRTKKTTFYQGEYFKGQEDRIPKIDINIPKQGEIFKSENLFVDMSKVNPAFRVGLANDINPNAKFFKDLSDKQKEIYKRNILDQTKFNLDKFYTKAGFPKEQINELKDILEFGTAEKLGIATTGTLFGTAAAADSTEATATGLTTGEKLLGVGTGVGAYKFRKPIIKTAKAVGKGALKLTGPLTVPLELGFIGADLKSGSTVPEALADVVLAGGIFREREKRKFIEDKYGKETLNRYVAAKTPGITDVMDMPTALPALSKELQAIDTEADAYLQTLRGQRAEEFKKKSTLPKPRIDEFQAAGGGIAGLSGGDPEGAMLESMNPDSQGLQGLMKRVRNR